MCSDLNQTGQFTSLGHKEANPLVAGIVEHKTSYGEAGLALLGLSTLIISDRIDSRLGAITQGLYVVGHGWAVKHNYDRDWRDNIVVGPIILTLKW